MEDTGGEVQITDCFGKISTADRATGEFLFGKVHFRPVSPGSGRVSGQIHRSLLCDCSDMQITDLMETNIRLTEQLIVGTKHVEVQEKLLEKGDALASLEAAMDNARTFEATEAHVTQLQATGPLQVHAVALKRTSSSHLPCGRCGTSHGSKWDLLFCRRCLI